MKPGKSFFLKKNERIGNSCWDSTDDRTLPGYPSKVPRVVPPSGVPMYNP